MFEQSPDRLEPMGPEEHDRQIAGDPLEGGKGCGQGTHVEAFEAEPGEVVPLNGTGARHLSSTGIDRDDRSSRTDLFRQVEGRNAMAGGHIENLETGAQI